MFSSPKSRLLLAALIAAVVALGAGGFSLLRTNNPTRVASTAEAAPSRDWPAYMYDAARSGFNAGEVWLSPDNAPDLKLLWKQKIGDVLAAQPVVKHGLVYAGSWDGNLYALDVADGSIRWKANLGKTSSKICVPSEAGITSAAAVTDDMLYVGGGDENLYALNPLTGETIWKFRVGDNSEKGGLYNWASPVVSNGRVYYGSSSFCDRPFVYGEIWALDARTGEVEQQASFVPEGQLGGGIWTSPTIDEVTGDVYVTLGSGDYYIPHSYSMARLHPETLEVADAWQIPIEVQVFDGDWGTTPTIFRNRDGKLMVGGSAKNGYYYAFDADNITKGPAWSAHIADGGSCPQCGEGAISTSVYAYNTIYVAAGYQSIGQVQKFPGTVRALDPTTGAIRWLHPTSGWVIPALAAANGLVVAAADNTVEVLHAGTGELLWEYATGATIYAAPTIAGGVLYVASNDGYLYAFSAGPYPDQAQAYKIEQVGDNPPPFTPFRTPVAAQPLEGAEECFSDTGKCVRGEFLRFWQERGGLERFGPAVTDELNEAGRTVQYFRNAVLQMRPKYEGEGLEPDFGRLDFRLFYHTPEDDNFEPADPAGTSGVRDASGLTPHDTAAEGEIVASLANVLLHEEEAVNVTGTTGATGTTEPMTGTVYFKETRHNLSEPFLSFWRAHGEVGNIGYPVSEPYDEYNVVDGQTRRVQYFERARLEIVAGEGGSTRVAFGALGLQKYLQRYGKLP